jgi:hypothetical protein
LGVFEVPDHCGEGSSGFFFTEHLVLWCDEISSIEKPQTLPYGVKNLIGKFISFEIQRIRVAEIRVMEETSRKKLIRKIFLLRVIGNPSYGRNRTRKRREFFPVT